MSQCWIMIQQHCPKQKLKYKIQGETDRMWNPLTAPHDWIILLVITLFSFL